MTGEGILQHLKRDIENTLKCNLLFNVSFKVLLLLCLKMVRCLVFGSQQKCYITLQGNTCSHPELLGITEAFNVLLTQSILNVWPCCCGMVILSTRTQRLGNILFLEWHFTSNSRWRRIQWKDSVSCSVLWNSSCLYNLKHHDCTQGPLMHISSCTEVPKNNWWLKGCWVKSSLFWTPYIGLLWTQSTFKEAWEGCSTF